MFPTFLLDSRFRVVDRLSCPTYSYSFRRPPPSVIAVLTEAANQILPHPFPTIAAMGNAKLVTVAKTTRANDRHGVSLMLIF